MMRDPALLFVRRLQSVDVVDRLAEPMESLSRAIAPRSSRRGDLLRGRALGHPLHPMLTDVVVGSWTSAFVLDRLGRRTAAAADVLVGVGLVAAAPTAASGLSDWGDLRGGARRVGTAHALGNGVALTLHAASWLARRRTRRRAGRWLSAVGLLCAGASAWLGGALTFAHGAGVSRAAFDELPTEWARAIEVERLRDDALEGLTIGDAPIVVVRHVGTIFALGDRCTHRGCLLHEGALELGHIVCPCHGSTFALDGTVVAGPATVPQPVLDARVREGWVEVRRPGADAR